MNPGDIVLVKFPFTDLELNKKRPALLLRQTRHAKEITLFTIAMITSRVDSFKLDGDVMLSDWKAAHLLHPSLVRLSKIATVEKELIQQILGRSTASDLKEVKKQFQRLFDFWI